MNPYAKTGAYTEASVLTAPPGRLVVMLYDGALRFIAQAGVAMRSGDPERARDRLRRVEAIIDELNLALDMRYGELPAQLRAIYLFCKRELRDAATGAQPEQLERVARLLADLREGWDEAASRAEDPERLAEDVA